jgi:hypothetical protein
MKPAVKKRIALVAVLGATVVVSAGLRGCWDFTKPAPWVSDAPSSARDTPPAAR